MSEMGSIAEVPLLAEFLNKPPYAARATRRKTRQQAIGKDAKWPG
jgi:hypothetical protein